MTWLARDHVECEKKSYFEGKEEQTTDLMSLVHGQFSVVQLFVQVAFLLTEQLLTGNNQRSGHHVCSWEWNQNLEQQGRVGAQP